MSDRYPISNQQSSNTSAKQGGSVQRAPLKIAHGGCFRGVRTNVGPNQTGYDHMYATDTEDGQPQQQQQHQAVLNCATSASGTSVPDTPGTVIPEDHYFLKDFLLIHLDIIQQQNEEILKKDKIIFQLQQENALLKQHLNNLEQHNSSTDLTTIIHAHAAIRPTELPQDQQTALGDYSPESIPPTEDIVAPDVGDDMTLAESAAPLTASTIISSNNKLDGATTDLAAGQEDTAVDSLTCATPEASVEKVEQVQEQEQLVSSAIVIIEDDSTDADVPVQETVTVRTDLVERSDLLVENRVEQETVGGDTVADPQQLSPTPTPAPTPDHTVFSPAKTDHALCSPNSRPAPTAATATVPAAPATTTSSSTTRYSVVRNSLASDSGGESNSKNLRMSIRRKRLCSGSSLSNSADATTLEAGETARVRLSASGRVGKEGSRSKRKRLNGQILTYPQEYVTRVGETNVDVLRQQALADEVIKATNLEVPHWRVKVYADSYHLEGTENLDDEVFLKRHAKLEINERRRKRWDVQRIREQRLIEKLKQRQTKTHQPNADHNQSKLTTNGGLDARPDSLDGYDTPASLWPTPEQDLHYIEVTEQLPVAAFGAPLPALIPTEFSLPWLGSRKAQSVQSTELDTPPVVAVAAPTAVVAQSNNGRKSAGGRKSRDSLGGSNKGRSRR